MHRLWPDPGEVDDVEALVRAEARPPHASRPWLLVNMVASLDGAVTVDGRSGGLGGPADRAVFHALRSVADVILVGAGTVRAERYRPAGTAAVAVVTRSLDLDLGSPLFTEADHRTIVITCKDSPADRRAAAAEVADVLIAGPQEIDLAAAIGLLAERGARVVNCEGGPSLNASLLSADLIDEWNLTIAPLLVGGNGGRSSAGNALPDPRRYELARLLEADGLLLGRWLRSQSYRFVK